MTGGFWKTRGYEWLINPITNDLLSGVIFQVGGRCDRMITLLQGPSHLVSG